MRDQRMIRGPRSRRGLHWKPGVQTRVKGAATLCLATRRGRGRIDVPKDMKEQTCQRLDPRYPKREPSTSAMAGRSPMPNGETPGVRRFSCFTDHPARGCSDPARRQRRRAVPGSSLPTAPATDAQTWTRGGRCWTGPMMSRSSPTLLTSIISQRWEPHPGVLTPWSARSSFPPTSPESAW